MRKTLETEAREKRVLIVGEEGKLSATLTRLLRREAALADGAEAVGAGHALQAIIRVRPDIVLVDMPKAGRTWIELIKQVKGAAPQIKVLAVCGEVDARSADRVLRAGADGYILRQESADEITHAIHDVLAGGLYVSEKVLPAFSKPRRSSDAKSRVARPASRAYATSFWNHATWARATVKSPVRST